MSNIEDVRRLKEEIIASFDARMSTIANIVKSTSDMATATREMTQRFRTEHQTMSDDLRMKLNEMKKSLNTGENLRREETRNEMNQRLQQLSDLLGAFRGDGNSQFSQAVSHMLNHFQTTRLNDFNLFMKDLQQHVVQIKSDVKNMQHDFQQSQQAMSQDLNGFLFDFKTNLKNFKENLSQNEKERFKHAHQEIQERTAWVEKLFQQVGTLVTDFNKDHAEMSKILKEMISFKGFNKERLHDFHTMMDQIQQNQQQREKDTTQLLSDFSQTHDSMAKNLSDMLSTMKSDLEKSDQTRHDQAQKDLQQRLGYLANMKSEISNMLSTLQNESREALREWKDLARILGEKSRTEPGNKPAATETPKAKPVVSVPSSPATTDFGNGEAKAILAILRENSNEGMRLVDLSKKIEKKWQTLIPLMKQLVDTGQIKKQDNLYFPV